MDSISPGSSSAIPSSLGKPSMTYKGSLLWVMEIPPRTRMEMEEPGPPSDWVTCTPATRPAKACVTSEVGVFIKSSLFTETTEPVKSLRLEVPYPITTTSSSILLSCFNCTSIFVLPLTGTFCVAMPIKENCNTSFASARME